MYYYNILTIKIQYLESITHDSKYNTNETSLRTITSSCLKLFFILHFFIHCVLFCMQYVIECAMDRSFFYIFIVLFWRKVCKNVLLLKQQFCFIII